jgi:hypothetical protein
VTRTFEDDGALTAALQELSGAVPAPPANNTAELNEPPERPALRQELTTKALRASHLAVDTIIAAFETRGADIDDAIKALPQLHRVLEHVEKLDVAKKAGTAGASALLVIVLDDDVTQIPPPRRTAQRAPLPLAEVIERPALSSTNTSEFTTHAHAPVGSAN